MAAVLCVWSADAGAIPLTRSFEVEASDLRSQIFDQGVFPITDPIFGAFTVTFDPAGPAIMEAEVPLGGLNVLVASPIGFNYLPDQNLLMLGGLDSGVDRGGIADFRLHIGEASTLTPEFLYFSYSTRREYWIAASGSVALVGVPEAGSRGLFGFGLGSLVLLSLWRGWQRGRAAAIASRRSVPAGWRSWPARWSRGRSRPARRTG